jgi:hypothetical protein
VPRSRSRRALHRTPSNKIFRDRRGCMRPLGTRRAGECSKSTRLCCEWGPRENPYECNQRNSVLTGITEYRRPACFASWRWRYRNIQHFAVSMDISGHAIFCWLYYCRILGSLYRWHGCANCQLDKPGRCHGRHIRIYRCCELSHRCGWNHKL